MAAFIQSQAFARPSCLSCSVLKNTSSSKASKLHTYPFVLNPNIWRRRLPQFVFTSVHLKASSSSSKFIYEKMTMQRTLQNRTMPFAGESAAGNAEEEEEPRNRDIDFGRPFKVVEVPTKPIDYRPWVAGFFVLLYIMFREVIVVELIRWLKYFVLLLHKVVVVLYTLLKPLVPLAAVVTTGTAWAAVIVKEVYAFIFNMTSVPAFTEAIVLSSAVLGIGEATKVNAVSSQPYTIGLATCLGLGAVLGILPANVFVALLLTLVSFSLVVKKKDTVSSIMPVAAVLAAVAEPWLRAFAVASFLALAIHQNWKSPEKEGVSLDNGLSYEVQPIIILRVLSLMVGIAVAADWLYFRHLIWLAK